MWFEGFSLANCLFRYIIFQTTTLLFPFPSFLILYCVWSFELLASALSWWILITRLRDELTCKAPGIYKRPSQSTSFLSTSDPCLAVIKGKFRIFEPFRTEPSLHSCLRIFLFLSLRNWHQLPIGIFCSASVNGSFSEKQKKNPLLF